MISLIVAVSDNNVIGDKGKLPWQLPADLRRFKELTLGHPIIMGRKTYESIGRALPGRRNIVITRDKNYLCHGVDVAHSWNQALSLCNSKDEVFIIGGGEIYKIALPLADRIYLTRVHISARGDTYFPEIDPADWIETGREDYPADAANPYAHTFFIYERKK